MRADLEALIQDWELVIEVCKREQKLNEECLKMKTFASVRENVKKRIWSHELEIDILKQNIKNVQAILEKEAREKKRLLINCY